MELFIKQKVFSWKDHFSVKDRQGRDCYLVEGKLFSWGKKLHVFDQSGKEVLYIEQRLWKWLPTYVLFIEGKEAAVVKQEFSFFKPRYTIEGPNWRMEGSFGAHQYQIKESGKVIADISKGWFTWGDSYALRINDEGHALLALGVIIVIDCVIASQQSASSGS